MYPSLYLERLNNAKLPELKQICKELGLKSGGLKQDVITRIYDSFCGSYNNYHAIVPNHYQNTHMDIGTALIYGCDSEVKVFGDNYYYIRIYIYTNYKNGEYRSKFYMNIHYSSEKQAQAVLDNLIKAIQSSEVNAYIRAFHYKAQYGIHIIPIKDDRIVLSTNWSSIEIKEYPIGYIEKSIEDGYNKYLDVMKNAFGPVQEA